MSEKKRIKKEVDLDKEKEGFIYFDDLVEFFDPLKPHPIEGLRGKKGLTAKAIADSLGIELSTINSKMKNVEFREIFYGKKEIKGFFAERYKAQSGRGFGWVFDQEAALVFLKEIRTDTESHIRYTAWLEDPNTAAEQEEKRKKEWETMNPSHTGEGKEASEAIRSHVDDEEIRSLNHTVRTLNNTVAILVEIIRDMPLTCSQRKEFSSVYRARCDQLAIDHRIPSSERIHRYLFKHVKTVARCCWDGDNWKDIPQGKYKLALEAARTFELSSKDLSKIEADTAKQEVLELFKDGREKDSDDLA